MSEHVSSIDRDDLRSLRTRVAALVRETTEPDVMVKLASVLDYDGKVRTAEAALRDSERAQRTEAVRFYIPIIAPLVTALTVVAALLFQAIQFRENATLQKETVRIQHDTARIQAQAADDAQWRSVAQTLSANVNPMNAMTGTAMLIPFVKSGGHQEEARIMAMYLLRNTVDFDGFKELFDAEWNAKPPDQRLAYELHVARLLKDAYAPIPVEEAKIPPEISHDDMMLSDAKGHRVPNPFWIEAQINHEVGLVGERLASTLRAQKQSVATTDMRDCALWDTDFSFVVFPQANVEGTSFYGDNFNGADLRGLVDFDRSNWVLSTWWRAKYIRKDLLVYLERKFPYDPRTQYVGTKSNKAEYQAAIDRLSRG